MAQHGFGVGQDGQWYFGSSESWSRGSLEKFGRFGSASGNTHGQFLGFAIDNVDAGQEGGVHCRVCPPRFAHLRYHEGWCWGARE